MKDLSEKKPISPYQLHIDEEGFPVLNGYRADDPEFLQLTFPYITRLIQGENRSPLMVNMEDKLVYVEAFDAPFVAQMVEDVTEESSTWIFPGDFKKTVLHKDLFMDRWDRLHSYIGQDEIPAVLSRKAQQKLLLNDSFKITEFKKFRDLFENNVNEEEFWSQCYTDSGDGWEIGQVNPTLAHYNLDFLDQSSPILVPGAGRGHEARYFEENGFSQVIALDISPEAKKEYERLYPSSNVNFLVKDLFEYLPQEKNNFAAVFELNIFCAIDPKRRQDYIEKVHQSLRDKGIYFGVFLLRSSPGGPPFGLTQWELREEIKDLFNIKQWEMSQHSIKRRLGMELWVVLEKK